MDENQRLIVGMVAFPVAFLVTMLLTGCASDIGPSPSQTLASPHHDNPRGETWMGRRQ